MAQNQDLANYTIVKMGDKNQSSSNKKDLLIKWIVLIFQLKLIIITSLVLGVSLLQLANISKVWIISQRLKSQLMSSDMVFF